MTGLKSGSGDDLWGDESDETDEADAEETESKSDTVATDAESPTNNETEQTSQSSVTNTRNEENSASSSDSTTSSESMNQQQPYIVRRAVQDKSIKFERDERLTFFVHDDVVDGERNLITDMESELGRSIPKFDVREAVYRAALRNRDDILDELLKMGYSTDDS
ncbi:hypothetical protein [Halorussus lipolyticus]|uniref:hypothetical protein n=1 Tax=Halorussus lipolyticus TaxID=3034024 RepID=UPI0023E81ECC|nr:hypothetical protein [Halorussus sp. DT80]